MGQRRLRSCTWRRRLPAVGVCGKAVPRVADAQCAVGLRVQARVGGGGQRSRGILDAAQGGPVGRGLAGWLCGQLRCESAAAEVPPCLLLQPSMSRTSPLPPPVKLDVRHAPRLARHSVPRQADVPHCAGRGVWWVVGGSGWGDGCGHEAASTPHPATGQRASFPPSPSPPKPDTHRARAAQTQSAAPPHPPPAPAPPPAGCRRAARPPAPAAGARRGCGRARTGSTRCAWVTGRGGAGRGGGW